MKMQMKLCGIAMLVGMSVNAKAQTDPYDDDIYYSSKDKKHYVSHISESDINKSNAASPAQASGQSSAANQNSNNSGAGNSTGNNYSSGSNGTASKSSGDTYVTNNYNGDYSTRLRRFYGPSVGLNYYNSFYDPFAYSFPYYGYNSFGFGSYPYSYSGFSVGFGWGSPGYSCFNGGYNSFGYGGCNSFGYGGYNSFGYGVYNPYGYRGFGYNGLNNYNNGFYNGYNYGLYNSYNNNYVKLYYKESNNSNAPATTYGRRYDASGNLPPDGSTDQRSGRSSSMEKMQMDKTQTPGTTGKQEAAPAGPAWVDPRGDRGNSHVSNVQDNTSVPRPTYGRVDANSNANPDANSNANTYSNTNSPPANTYEAPQKREWIDPRGDRGAAQEQRQAAPQYQYPEPQERRRSYSEPTYSAPSYSAPAPSYVGGGGGSSSGSDSWGRRR